MATGTKGAERLGTKAGRGFSLAVGTMLAAILISSVSSAETSPRGELEDFFGQVTAILSVAGEGDSDPPSEFKSREARC